MGQRVQPLTQDAPLSLDTIISQAQEELPQTLFGYEVKSRLGVGAASTIYAVKDPKDGQMYALKHVLRREPGDDRFIAQLQNEFKVMGSIRHPGLRRCVNLIVNKTLFFKVKEAALVMELVDGIGLDERPPKDLKTVLDIFTQTAKALWEIGRASCRER